MSIRTLHIGPVHNAWEFPQALSDTQRFLWEKGPGEVTLSWKPHVREFLESLPQPAKNRFIVPNYWHHLMLEFYMRTISVDHERGFDQDRDGPFEFLRLRNYLIVNKPIAP